MEKYLYKQRRQDLNPTVKGMFTMVILFSKTLNQVGGANVS